MEVEAEGDGDYEVQRQKVLSILSRLGLHESIRSSYLELLEEKKMKEKKRKAGALSGGREMSESSRIPVLVMLLFVMVVQLLALAVTPAISSQRQQGLCGSHIDL